MPAEYIKFEERDILQAKGWTRIGMHCSKLTDMWTHPVHSVRERPQFVPDVEKDGSLAQMLAQDEIDFEKPGFVHLTREQALRAEGHYRADVIQKF